MPFIDTFVNTPLTEADKDTLAREFGRAITTIPGKSEVSLMLNFSQKSSMYFGGRKDTPMAFIEVSLLGTADKDVLCKMTAEMCRIMKEVLGIAPNKVYIKYISVNEWGFNGTNF